MLMLQMWHGVLFHDLPRAGILRNCFSSQKTVFFLVPTFWRVLDSDGSRRRVSSAI